MPSHHTHEVATDVSAVLPTPPKMVKVERTTTEGLILISSAMCLFSLEKR